MKETRRCFTPLVLAHFPVEEKENVQNNLFTFKKCALFTLDVIKFWILCSYVFIKKQFPPFSVRNWIRQETFDECQYRVQVGHRSFDLLYRRSNYCELMLQQPVSLPVVEPFLLAEPNKWLIKNTNLYLFSLSTVNSWNTLTELLYESNITRRMCCRL